MKKFIYILSILIFLPFHNLLANGSIRGKVTDPTTQLPITGATVSIVELQKVTATDLRGVYEFKGLTSGTYTLKVSFYTYETQEIQLEVSDTQSKDFNVELKPVGLDLPTVSIRSDVSPEDQMKTISAIDVALRPARSAQDVLRLVPGLFIAQHAGGGKAEQIFLRGFDIDHGTDVSISVDGMPVNMVSHAHGQGYADLHFLIPETIERVDFAKGLYAPAHGNFTTAGYVDFQTKRALSQSMVKLEAGRFNTSRVVGMFDLIPDNQQHHAYVAGEFMFSDGYFESPQNFTRTNALAKYHGILSDKSILTASFSTFTSQWDASGQIPQRAIDQGLITRFGAIDDTEGGSTSRSNANLQLTTFTDDGAVIKNQVFYTKYDFELFSNFTFFLEDSENGDQIRQHEDRQIIGYKGSISKRKQLGAFDLQSTAGISLRHDLVKDNELARTRNRTETLEKLASGEVVETNASIYIDERLILSNQFSIQAGLRYDQFRFEYEDALIPTYGRESTTKGILSPKLNFNFTPNEKLQFYLNNGTGFHSNDTRVILANTTRDILPRAYGSDLGLIVKPTKSLLIQAGVWGLWLDQEFVYVGDAGIVEPSGKTRRLGADISLRYQLASWLFADLDFNYTHPRSTEEDEGSDFIPLAPTVTSIGGLTARWDNGLNASLRYRYLGDRPANEDNSINAEGYMLLDAVLSYTHRKFEIGITLENILNEEWKEAQFDTESLLKGETVPVSEIHFTPGAPFFAKLSLGYFF